MNISNDQLEANLNKARIECRKTYLLISTKIDDDCFYARNFIVEEFQNIQMPISNVEILMQKNSIEDISEQRMCDIGQACHNESKRYWNDTEDGRFHFQYNNTILKQNDKLNAKQRIFTNLNVNVNNKDYFIDLYGLESGWSKEVVVDQVPTECQSSPFKLPWPGGNAHVVNQDPQNPGGSHSPGDYNNEWAIDFDHQPGDPVVAMDDGIILKIESGNNDVDPNSCNPSNAANVNYVSIKHANGSTLYLHLRRDSIIVRDMERVKRGQIIGYAGTSGYTCGPHLHITNMDSNTVGVDGFGKSIPIIFKDPAVCNETYNGKPKYYNPINGQRDSFISDNY